MKTILTLKAAFDPSKHPRGHEGNPGQFSKFAARITQGVGSHLVPTLVTRETVKVKGKYGKVVYTEDGKVKTKQVVTRTLANGKPLPKHLTEKGNSVLSGPIPPAWKYVHVSLDPSAKLQVRGMAANEKIQPLYSKEHSSGASEEKFDKVRELSRVKSAVVKEINVGMKQKDERLKQCALMAKIMMEHGIRAGSEKPTGRKKIYGLSTILWKHVTYDPATDKTWIRFIGKKGKPNSYHIKDKELAFAIWDQHDRAEELGIGDDEDWVFDKADYNHLRIYCANLHRHGFTPHNFRTLKGTETARALVKSMAAPRDAKTFKKKWNEVGDKVSRLLCNGRSEALKSYIDPEVFNEWRKKIGLAEEH